VTLGARVVSVAVALLLLGTSAGAQPAADPLDPAFLESIDDAQMHGTITPPGADTRHATAEIAAYDDLVQGYDDLTTDELRTKYFKDRRFGAVEDPERTYNPRAGVTVVRDEKWGEPHIFGATDADMAFGAGYVAAEDRLAIMELLRAVGRAEAFQLLGTTPAWLADGEMVRLYGYTEEEFQAQLDRLPKVYGKVGAEARQLLYDYVEGINAYLTDAARGEVPLPTGLAELGITVPAPYRPTDVVAVTSAVRALFGAGGGSEMQNAAVLAGLVEDFGPRKARRFYDDFRNRYNDDGPLHTVKSFPYLGRNAKKLDPKANVFGYTGGDTGIQVLLERLFDGDIGLARSQLSQLAEDSRIKYERLKLDTPIGSVDLSRPNSMSNHVIVGKTRSGTGHPILLGGPQAAYFSPQILMDYELHSPTIHARGAGFPGLSAIVIMGRTQNYAWTPTAGGSDMIDTYVVELCDPDGGEPDEGEYHYRYKGECVPMDRRVIRMAEDAPVDLPGRENLPDIIAERTVHGPVVARGKVGGTPVAVASKRSTYLKEVDAAVSILKMNRNEARTPEQFVEIFHESHNLSTNWGYINDEDIAYVHGGLYPMRPSSVDPDFPVWGSGQWEWKTDAAGDDRYLPSSRVPHEVNPKRDYVVSWNNRPARDWGSSDANWSYSSLYRSDMLIDGVLAAEPGTIDLVKITQIMEEAGLTDLRGRYVAPLALRVLQARSGQATDREREMIRLLRAWIDELALRRDGDANGEYDHDAAVAIMDAWWERMIRAVFDPALGDAGRIPVGFDNAPGPTGSAYQAGFYGFVWTDLASALGDPIRSPMSQVYCGGDASTGGTLGSCSDALWASFKAAGDALAQEQDTDDPSEWGVNEEGERIRFLPAAALSMHWVNRPTTQQLTMFGRLSSDGVVPDDGGGDDRVDPTADRRAGDGPSLPATGGGRVLLGLLIFAAGAFLVVQWRRRS
jgi:acyl-homoserine lactone acylase PvdQ